MKQNAKILRKTLNMKVDPRDPWGQRHSIHQGSVGFVGSVSFVGFAGFVGSVGSVGSAGFVGSAGSVDSADSVGSVGSVGQSVRGFGQRWMCFSSGPALGHPPHKITTGF